MKSPDELRAALRRQWENRAQREARLLDAGRAWPVVLSVGRPSPALMATDLDAVKRHLQSWRQVQVGEVVWESIPYRAATSPVSVPTQWRIRKPSEWVEACADSAMRREFEALAQLVEETDPMFHSLFVRRRSLWREKPIAAVVQAARLAIALEPGCAQGNPLRSLSLEGIDTKFFERHGPLLTTLLDARFDGEVSQLGLEAFLGAFVEGDHWLLVVDLDGKLLPFARQRVRAAELESVPLPGERLLIVENEQCVHQLPVVAGAAAVLGAGFDLGWTECYRGADRSIGYWGDIDTWGLLFLAAARQSIGQLDPVLMTADVFQQYHRLAVAEPVVAASEPPAGLTAAEQQLYRRLLTEPRGRLEQEFLPKQAVAAGILAWTRSARPLP